MISSGGGYVSEARDLFSAMTVAPGATRKGRIDRLIRDLQGNGIWSKLDLFYVLAAHDEQAGRLNWKNPGTNTLTYSGTGNAFTTDRGFTGNNSDRLLTASYTNNLYTQNNGHVACFTITNSADANIDFTITNVTPAIRGFVRPRNGTAGAVNVAGAAQALASVGITAPGMTAADRSDSANVTVYSNGAADGVTATASLGTTATAVNILADGIGGFADRQIAFAGCGASLTAAQHAILYSLVLSYMQGVGAA